MIIEICSHQIYYWYDDVNHEMDESSQEHVKNLLIENYKEGELCDLLPDQTEVRGWWSIAKEEPNGE